MKTLVALAVLICSVLPVRSAHARGAADLTGIPAGSKIFLENMDGFASDFSAALIRKKVPVLIVSERRDADYVVQAQASVENQSFWKTIFVLPVSAAHASIEMKARNGQLVFAYAVDRSVVPRGQLSTAEACAKHLKEIIRYEDEVHGGIFRRRLSRN